MPTDWELSNGSTDDRAELGWRQVHRAQSEASRAGGDAIGSSSDGAFAAILVAFLCFLWAIQKMIQSLQFWVLCLITVGVASAASCLAGRKLRRASDARPTFIKTIQVIVFFLVGTLLFNLFYDFGGLGAKTILVYFLGFLGFLGLGFICLLTKQIAKHPIRAALISIVGGWLVWILFFFQTPVREAVRAPQPKPQLVSKRHERAAKEPAAQTATRNPGVRASAASAPPSDSDSPSEKIASRQ